MLENVSVPHGLGTKLVADLNTVVMTRSTFVDLKSRQGLPNISRQKYRT